VERQWAQEPKGLGYVKITDAMKKEKGYAKIRKEWTNARLVGFREKKAKEAANKKPEKKEDE
jgi:hypothetical protein